MPPQPKKHSLSHPSPSTPNSSSSAVHKSSRTDSGGQHGASSSAGRKKSSSVAPARTGQACDRCKVRKIRCDNTLGGCIPCRQNNSECKTTDRITHRATARGHTEALERENSLLTRHVKDLEQQIVDLGASPRSFSYYSQSSEPYTSEWSQSASSHRPSWPPPGADPSTSGGDGSAYGDDTGDKHAQPHVFTLPVSLPEGGIDNYLGMTTSNDIAHDRGTSLSLFGMHLNLADFMSDSAQDPNNPRSYRALFDMLRVGMQGHRPPVKAALPHTYEECMHHVDLYMALANSAQPLLHPPVIRELVSKIYFQAYQPTPTEDVILHIVLATIKFQISARNDPEQTRDLSSESNAHYHYALTLLSQVFLIRTLEAVQALSLVCAHVRCFPMPEAGWMTGSWAINIAIDMGLHRSIGPWPIRATKDQIYRIEMRKRIFWTLFIFMVALSGKLGRPMPVHVGDFDIELPEMLNENLERVERGMEQQQCSFYGALFLWKRGKILCETYGTIYAVEPMHPYEQTLAQLEQKCRQLKSDLPPFPPDIQHGITDEYRGYRIISLIAHRSLAELELVLHHPALCTSKSADVMNKNLVACVEAANQLIRFTVQLMAVNAIDSTWYSTTSFIAAVFTLLFALEQRNQLDGNDMMKLRSDMGVCLEVFGNIGRMLGSGPRLRDKMAEIINKALERISRRQIQRAAAAASARMKDAQSAQPATTQQLQQTFKQEPTQNDYQPQQPLSSSNQQSQTQPSTRHSSAYMVQNEPSVPQHPSTTFASTQHNAYDGQPAVESTNQYSYNQFVPHTSAYQPIADITQASVPPTDAFLYQQAALAGSNAWHQWAQATGEQTESQDYTNPMNPAAALMALGGRTASTHSEASHHSAAPTQDMNYMGGAMPETHLDLPNLMPNTHMLSNMEIWSMSNWQAQSRVNHGS